MKFGSAISTFDIHKIYSADQSAALRVIPSFICLQKIDLFTVDGWFGYGIDYVYANELEVGEDGKLTGKYIGDIVDGKRKAELLKLIAQVEKVNLAQTIAVGDGANDLPMISEAGLGIAYHAKPRVKATAQQSISNIGLDGVLYFLGFKDSYLGEQGKL